VKEGGLVGGVCTWWIQYPASASITTAAASRDGSGICAEIDVDVAVSDLLDLDLRQGASEPGSEDSPPGIAA